MPRDLIEKENYLVQMHEEVDEIPDKFLMHKNKIEQVFARLVTFRDDGDTPQQESGLLQTKIDQGKAGLQLMLDNIS